MFFVLLNSNSVRVNLLITPLGFEMPLSLLVIVVFFLGFLVGCSGRVVRRGISKRAASQYDLQRGLQDKSSAVAEKESASID